MLIGFEAAARPTAGKSHIELEGCSRPGFVPAAALYANALPLENVRYAYQLKGRWRVQFNQRPLRLEPPHYCAERASKHAPRSV